MQWGRARPRPWSRRFAQIWRRSIDGCRRAYANQSMQAPSSEECQDRSHRGAGGSLVRAQPKVLHAMLPPPCKRQPLDPTIAASLPAPNHRASLLLVAVSSATKEAPTYLCASLESGGRRWSKDRYHAPWASSDASCASCSSRAERPPPSFERL